MERRIDVDPNLHQGFIIKCGLRASPAKEYSRLMAFIPWIDSESHNSETMSCRRI